MWAEPFKWTKSNGWSPRETNGEAEANVAIYFGSSSCMADEQAYVALKQRFPKAHLVGCTTGGEILGADVLDETLVVAAARFEHTEVCSAEESITGPGESFEAGRRLGERLLRPGLRAVFVLSDGTLVNGSELVRGLKAAVSAEVVVTGGLAGDGSSFKLTRVGGRSAPKPGVIAAVGFSGAALRVGHGSIGGWEAFGPERLVTRSTGNVLYELDGKPALDLYKRYLGEEAERLPASALLFPLSVRRKGEAACDLVRTILSVDECSKSMTFAGDVPEGAVAQLMRASFSHLVEGAADAAEAATGTQHGKLAVLISCIGRRLLMGQRVCDEVEAAAEILGEDCVRVGFYSYGEISPHNTTGVCDLHNQTMTITTFNEG